MEYVRLGQSELSVSRIGMGCEQLGGVDWGEVDETEICQAVRVALDRGVNLFDTADVYGLGRSEELLRRSLGSDRHDVVIATKFGIASSEDKTGGRAQTVRDCSAKHLVAALDGSLRRLEIDCIPLYQIHWPDPNVPIDETMEALIRCQEQGKIRYIGCCNFNAEQLGAALQTGRIISVQLEHSMLNPLGDGGLLDLCEKNGIGVLAYGVLARGLLTAKYGEGATFREDDRRSRLNAFRGEMLVEQLKVVDELRGVARRIGKSPAQVAIRWVLETPLVSAAISGIKGIGQLEENLGALDWRLPLEEYENLRQSWAEGESARSQKLG